jgi:UDP-N-acetylmuramate dehydrogenase
MTPSALADISAYLPKVRGKYQKEEPLSKHTWFGVGGPAEVMYHPKDADDLKHFLQNKPHNIPVCLIGGGSNLLVRDGGVLGVVIKLDSKNFQQIEIGENYIKCGAGLHNNALKKIILENNLGGLEFLCSIPGVIGGSIKTNAGCFGSEIKDVMLSAEVMNGLGEVNTLSPKYINLSYKQ